MSLSLIHKRPEKSVGWLTHIFVVSCKLLKGTFQIQALLEKTNSISLEICFFNFNFQCLSYEWFKVNLKNGYLFHRPWDF